MLVETFYHADEFCKELEKQVKFFKFPANRLRQRSYALTLSEIIAINIYYSFSGYKNFKDYYCNHVLVSLNSDFKNLVSYNRFVELQQKAYFPLMLFFKTFCLRQYKCTGISFIDSFSLKVCHNRRISSHKVFKKFARRGKTSVGWFFGFKVHFVINEYGQILSLYVTPGNISDNNSKVLKTLSKDLLGSLFGDKGYIVGKEMQSYLQNKGIRLITKIKKNMKNKFMYIRDKLLLRKRGIIESVIGILKNIFSIEHTRHRNIFNFLTHIFSTLIAYTLRKKKPSLLCNNNAFAINA